MNTLQRALLPNGILALTSGGAVALLRHQLSQIFGIENTQILLIIGIIVSIFGLSVLAEVKMQRALATLWIITQDALWAIGTIVLIVFQPFELTDAAYWIIALYALPVVVFVWFQGHGLSTIDTKSGSSRKIFNFKRKVKADKNKVWEVVSDVGNYHEVAPNIDDSKIISGQGLGMVRKCAHGKDQWAEKCTLWDEGNEYSFEVETSAPDYPYPLKFLKGTWRVSEIQPNVTEIEMEFEFEYKKKIQNILVHPFMKSQFTKVCKKLLDTWQKKLE
jgi:ribosome-associated toxin RatA of RatAB toxin-antitoxin module